MLGMYSACQSTCTYFNKIHFTFNDNYCYFSFPNSALVLLEGVRENHEAHLEYLKYLMSLQQQCYDASLQVNSVQTVIDR